MKERTRIRPSSILPEPPVGGYDLIEQEDDPRIRRVKENPFLLTWSDPIKFVRTCWPDIRLYDKQEEILLSVRDNDETIVPAGNDLGKDFIAALAAIWFFCSRSPCRVVTTSVDGSQLEGVLWGEMRRFIQSSVYPLPILYNHLKVRQIVGGKLEPRSELIGRVVKKGEGLLGRHIERGPNWRPSCMAVYDEASGLDDTCYETSDTWTHRKLIIGNPYPCENFFRRFTEAGDLRRDDEEGGYVRRVIHIPAEASPNVRLGVAEIQNGKKPSNREIIPGVLSHRLYKERRRLWNPMRQCIGLDARFYKGSEVMLYPEQWLNFSKEFAEELLVLKKRLAMTMGVDAAEGNDSTVWTIIDHLGVLYQRSEKTHDTADIPGITIGLMREYGLRPENVLFDRGGGGKQHADQLRRKGFPVRTVGFGESADDPSMEPYTVKDGQEIKETRYEYRNRRAEMYGLLRRILNPVRDETIWEEIEQQWEDFFTDDVMEDTGRDRFPKLGFGIPAKYHDLHSQLLPMPIKYDEEGRMWLPPKNKKRASSKEPTLKDILGRSPDEADSLVLAVFGLLRPIERFVAGAVVL